MQFLDIFAVKGQDRIAVQRLDIQIDSKVDLNPHPKKVFFSVQVKTVLGELLEIIEAKKDKLLQSS